MTEQVEDTDKTFVFENVEVKKTGRVAHRKLRSSKIDVLVEITPVDEKTGTWKKWARPAELFEVGDGGEENA